MICDLTIIIVSWNTKKLLYNCIDSIFKNIKNVSFEVIVVDNASTDGSGDMVQSLNFQNLYLIYNKDNMGFVKANNIGVRYAKGRYLLLLNSDTEIFLRQVDSVVSYMDNHIDVGISAGRLLNTDLTFQRPFKRFPTVFDSLFRNTIGILKSIWYPGKKHFLMTHLDPNYIHDVDWLTGAYLFIRKNVLEDDKVFDEDLFMYYEDTLLCRKLKNNGHRVVYLPFAPVIHHKGKSSEKVLAISVLRDVSSSIIYHRKVNCVLTSQVYKIMILIGWFFIYGGLVIACRFTHNNKIVQKKYFLKELLENRKLL